jgi:hypothetical protein
VFHPPAIAGMKSLSKPIHKHRNSVVHIRPERGSAHEHIQPDASS